MKTARIVSVAVALTLFLSNPVDAQTGQELLQQALVAEQAEGDLQEAIRLYERIVEEFGTDRRLAARALVQIGRCYEKLGSQEAERAYQRVVSDYADQTEFVAQARELLAKMRGPAQAGAEQPLGITTRQVHKWVYGEAFPLAITPDGTDLIYVDNWFGNLAVRDLQDGDSRTLTQDSSWSAWGARVSPDGRTVSYLLAEATSSIHLVGIDGSNSRALYREVGCPVSHHEWTSDGEHIIALVGCGEITRVMRISPRDGNAELVRELGPGRWGGISLSPDNRYLAYGLAVEGDGGNSDIWMLSLDGSVNVPLVRHPANDGLLGWMPESDEVLFLSDRDGTLDLWALRVTGDTPEGPPRTAQRNVGQIQPLGFASNGDLFYNTYRRWFSTGVAPYDLATGTVALESIVGILGSNMQPVWSPDGKYLALVPELEGPNGSGGPYQRPLHIYDLATGSKRELASHLQTRNPRWSPDGQSIILCGRNPVEDPPADGFGGLYVVDVESGITTQVLKLNPETATAFWSDLGAAWSEDGTAIIYALYDNELDEGRLVWLNLETGEERELYRDPRLTTRQLAVSPDGHRLAFALRSASEGYSSSIHSGGRLMFLDLDGGEIEEFHQIDEPGRVWSLQWTPDGGHVLYTKRGEDHRTSVWQVPVSGGPAEETWIFQEDHYDAYISLSPDGKQVAYTTYHQEVEVWVMENLLSGGGEGGR